MGGSHVSEKAAGVYHEARASLPRSVGGPRQWLGMYEDFISKNASSVSQIESGLRSLTYLVPGRFQEAEIASESLHSFIQLISLYHDSLLSRVYSSLPASIPRPIRTPHNRYTKFWSSRSPLYRRVALLLQSIQYTELLWEMTARRRGGDRARWRAVVFLEGIKALCRLLLMRLTKSRPLVSPALPEREIDPRILVERTQEGGQWDGMDIETDNSGGFPEHTSEASSEISWTMPRTGLSLPSLPDSSEITDFLLKKVLTADDIKAPKQLLHRMTTIQSQLAELMWVLRPVLYAVAMQRLASHNRKIKSKGGKEGLMSTWAPWIGGLALEIAARRLQKKDFSERVAGGLRGLTGLEREELGKRGWSLGWWAMRGAFYEDYTGPLIRGVADKLRGKPVVDLVGGIIGDYEHLWNEYYFSTSTL